MSKGNDAATGAQAGLWSALIGRFGRKAGLGGPERRRVTIENREKPITDWKRSNAGSIISVRRDPLIGPDAKIFAMGSCFAVEIRNALSDLGFAVLPRYFDIAFDRSVEKLGGLPERDSINHYDTFTIRQEFERAFAPQEPREEDYWTFQGKVFSSEPELSYQDPHRKLVFGRSLDSAFEATRKLDDCVRNGILEADIYVITLGLIEVWKNQRSGRYICQAPLKRNADVVFECSDFASNLANMRRVCGLLRENFPHKKVILTVSPVPLSRTFTGRDVVVANMESKSVLRAVAGQIEREFENVVYWPSFEIASRENLFLEDGRHVSPAGVAKIVSAFVAAHCDLEGLEEGAGRRAGQVAG